VRPLRSVLYVPGSNARALEKAASLPADALILDLEDAVAPEAKAEARRRIADLVGRRPFGRRIVAIRVNALRSEWGEGDLEAAAAAAPDAILLPKVETADDVWEVGRRLARLGTPPEVELWAMMETPGAVLHAGQISAAVEEDAGRRLSALVMGTNDLAKETGARMTSGRLAFTAWLSQCVLAARACDLAILDGVFAALHDAAGFAAECEQGRVLGFDGKTLIHPGQIEAANRAFAPHETEVEEARKIIDAFQRPENRGRGAISLDGRMIERLHADMAVKVLALHEAIQEREGG
jgi:citrate lyase subunit beta/citryl-CoA lyase